MPESIVNPLPKYSVIKVFSELTRFVNLWILKRIIFICILLKHHCKKTMPTGEDCVVKHWKPVKEINLT